MQDMFNFLTELAIDPFASASAEQRQQVRCVLNLAGTSAQADELIAQGSFDACRTCSDPGPDEPFPDSEDEVSS
jgi:hypothetical protein